MKRQPPRSTPTDTLFPYTPLSRSPFSIIAPVIIAICAIGAFTVHNALLDTSFMLIFGIIGYAFKKLDYPLAPLVLALVLGDMAESPFRNAMILSAGDYRADESSVGMECVSTCTFRGSPCH